MNYVLILSASIFFLISCSNNPHLSTEDKETSQSSLSTGGGAVNGASACGSGVPGKGLSCTGTTADGDGCNRLSIGNYHVKLAGRQSWFPQRNEDSSLYPQQQETKLRFVSDGRLRVRVKVNPQPEPFSGHSSTPHTEANQIHNCPGRVGGADNPGGYRYQKLSFDVKFYTSKFEQKSTGSSGQKEGDKAGQWVKDRLLHKEKITGLKVDACSPIIDLPAEKIKSTPNPILVEITQVSNDLFCHVQGIYCPSERIMRPQECYSIVVQVVNDISDDFK